MIKFKFDYQNNTLAYQTEAGNTWYQLTEEQQFPGNFGSLGFSLDSGWMTFTVQANQIRVFYKQISDSWADLGEPTSITYYRQDLPKECPLIFTFTKADEVEKVNGQWAKKGGQP